MSSTADPRHVALAGTFNVRDAGGYPVSGGGQLRPGLLYRGDALGRIDDTGRATLVERGLRTIIDLREDDERSRVPDALTGLDLNVVHQPLYGQGHGQLPSSLEAVYETLVDDRGRALAAGVGALAAPGALPALVHCTAGKDRTGVVVALTQSVAGVSDADIAEDYARTSVHLTEDFVAVLLDSLAGFPMTPELRVLALNCPPELILRTLDRVRNRSGSVESYLLEHGLAAADIAALRFTLTTDPAGG